MPNAPVFTARVPVEKRGQILSQLNTKVENFYPDPILRVTTEEILDRGDFQSNYPNPNDQNTVKGWVFDSLKKDLVASFQDVNTFLMTGTPQNLREAADKLLSLAQSTENNIKKYTRPR